MWRVPSSPSDGSINARALRSLDGQWVAYESTESGQEEIHVRPFPMSPWVTGRSRRAAARIPSGRQRGTLFYRDGTKCGRPPTSRRRPSCRHQLTGSAEEQIAAPIETGHLQGSRAREGALGECETVLIFPIVHVERRYHGPRGHGSAHRRRREPHTARAG